MCETQGEEGQELCEISRERGHSQTTENPAARKGREFCSQSNDKPLEGFKPIGIQYNLGF